MCHQSFSKSAKGILANIYNLYTLCVSSVTLHKDFALDGLL